MAKSTLPTRPLTDEKVSVSVIDISSDSDDGGSDVRDQPERGSGGEQAAREETPDSSWDIDSIYEDILEEIEEHQPQGGPHQCTAEEAKNYRKRLQEVGAGQFVLETVTAGKISARKLLTAFGIKTAIFEGQPDETYYPLLGLAIARELSKRIRLPQYKTIDDAAKLLNESKNIMVITGAGISTSLGIPDFRSKDTGFYSKLTALGFSEPEEIFNIHNFDEDPSTFYALAGDILPDLNRWSPTHQFIKLLQDNGKLLTNYTQNIDNLESHAGVKVDKLIQCHGSWATATCRKCGYTVPGEQIFEAVRSKEVAQCERCIQQLKLPRSYGLKRKRSSNGSTKSRRQRGSDDDDSDGDYDIPEPGVMKPDITFFGEQLPKIFFDRLQQHDRDIVDLVIVIGTSMKVAPVSEVPRVLPANVPQIYISRDPIHHLNFDINLLGNCDTIVSELCRRAGWSLEHEMISKDQQILVRPSESLDCQYTVTEVRS